MMHLPNSNIVPEYTHPLIFSCAVIPSAPVENLVRHRRMRHEPKKNMMLYTEDAQVPLHRKFHYTHLFLHCLNCTFCMTIHPAVASRGRFQDRLRMTQVSHLVQQVRDRAGSWSDRISTLCL